MPASFSPGASPPSGSSPFISDNLPHHLPRPQAVQRFRVRFTGSGSEYFRIWIVNLLLTVATAGLYYPWARARQLRYFCSNTQVASHALGFHGEPRKMARAWWLSTGLVLVSAVTAWYSQPAGITAGLVLLALWPALHQASAQTVLAHTRWRGLRFALNSSVADTYLALATPALAVVCLLTLGLVLMPTMLLSIEPAAAALGSALCGALMCLGLAALLPYTYWRFKSHQHQHYAYAQLRTDFRARYRDVAKVFMNTAGVAALSALLAVALGGMVFALGLLGRPDSIRPINTLASARQAMPMWLGLLVLAQILPLVYFKAHAQNMVWTHTGNRSLRFKSDLGFLPLLKLSLKNWTLMALTLGLYWPFATVAMTRLRLQSICIHMRISPDLLVAQAQGQRQRTDTNPAGITPRISLGVGL